MGSKTGPSSLGKEPRVVGMIMRGFVGVMLAEADRGVPNIRNNAESKNSKINIYREGYHTNKRSLWAFGDCRLQPKSTPFWSAFFTILWRQSALHFGILQKYSRAKPSLFLWRCRELNPGAMIKGKGFYGAYPALSARGGSQFSALGAGKIAENPVS